jgi:hypothetical protein
MAKEESFPATLLVLNYADIFREMEYLYAIIRLLECGPLRVPTIARKVTIVLYNIF